MSTGNVRVNGIQIEYESLGGPDADPMLLIMGLGGQLTLWDDEFCQLLVQHGFQVTRFDNRDVGLSSEFDSAGVPNILELVMAVARGEQPETPYSLDDMADDAAGLLDALSVERAHVVGASMGGMIAQTLAIRHPARLKSLTSIMSSTGHPDAPEAKPEVMAKLLEPPAGDRAGRIEQGVELWRTIGSPGFAFDEQRTRERVARDHDRCFHPQGTARQMAAILTHGSREQGLGKLSLPALVIHGADDPLVPLECGQMTARAIPGAELLVIDGMGHDFPPALFEQITDTIAEHAKGAS